MLRRQAPRRRRTTARAPLPPCVPASRRADAGAGLNKQGMTHTSDTQASEKGRGGGSKGARACAGKAAHIAAPGSPSSRRSPRPQAKLRLKSCPICIGAGAALLLLPPPPLLPGAATSFLGGLVWPREMPRFLQSTA
eukprot:5857507-Prymnesium_polylepis.2